MKMTDVAPDFMESSLRSRRKFLKETGLAVAAGAAVLVGCTQTTPTPEEVIKEVEVTRQVDVEVTRQVEVEVAKEIPASPWQYVELDVEEVRKRGHEGYYRGECCFGAFAAILEALRDKVGYPFTQIPAEMMGFGAGGVSGWGTTCGALIGAAAAINLVTEKDLARKIVSELMGLYSVTPFPSETSNNYAANHEFLVAEYKSDKVLPQSVSNSPLCHVSVTQWCKTSAIASGAPERSERCGRLSGDVAAMAAELLNANLAAAFVPVFQLSQEAQGCTTCHTRGENFAAGNFTNGKGECLDCHEPHQ
ncbi:MAG: C-GCAxxG-C-C family (seleno)protein [Bellilinea sp.]